LIKLVSAHITNFRCVKDSEEFTLDQVTCLVGKNEAGKTTILKALYGIKPWDSTENQYDRERDYPRRYLTDYEERHPNGKPRSSSPSGNWSRRIRRPWSPYSGRRRPR
jgi:energy-coupling factor transporter ATP-binding protein EcfA2